MRRVIVFAVVLGLVFAGGMVMAHDNGQVYSGCVTPGGDLTNVAIGEQPLKECKGQAVPISWNETGPRGEVGPAGPQGEVGPAGPAGPPGPGGSDVPFWKCDYCDLALMGPFYLSPVCEPNCGTWDHNRLIRTAATGFAGRDLTGASLFNASLSQGVCAEIVDWTYPTCAEATVDLAGTILTGAHMMGIHARGVDFSGANLSKAELIQGAFFPMDVWFDIAFPPAQQPTMFDQADLSGALVEWADFTQASFVGANLTGVLGLGKAPGADFTNATLAGALINTTLADFTGAIWSNTTCPDNTNSDDNGGTCEGHLTTFPPSP